MTFMNIDATITTIDASPATTGMAGIIIAKTASVNIETPAKLAAHQKSMPVASSIADCITTDAPTVPIKRNA